MALEGKVMAVVQVGVMAVVQVGVMVVVMALAVEGKVGSCVLSAAYSHAFGKDLSRHCGNEGGTLH